MKTKSIRQKIVYKVVLIGVLVFLASVLLVYCFFVPNMKKRAISNAEQTNAEIAQQISTLNSYIEDYTENLVLAVEKNPDIMNYFEEPSEQNKQVAALNLNNLISSEGLARSVFIISESNDCVDSLNRITQKDNAILQTEWYQKLHEAKYARGFAGVYEIEFNKGKYYTTAYLKNFYFQNRCYTYLVFYDLNNLIYDITVSVGNTLDYFELIDSKNQVFYIGGDNKWRTSVEDSTICEERKGHQFVQDGVALTRLSVDSKWRMNSFISNQSVFKTFANYVAGIVLIFSLFLILLCIFLANALKDVINPIEQLSQEMGAVAQGNLDCKLDTLREDEIGQLYLSFNQMTKELKQSLDIISEKEKMESQARFSLLVSQIDPHFIYNTINSINYLARKKRCEDIITVNSALIFILQDRLRVNDIQISDSIGYEMKVLDQYIMIQQYMYDGDLQFVWNVPDNLLEEQIPKNMIQPIVENSLFHGLIDEESGDITGKIEITISKVQQTIRIQVQDDGQGMDADRLEQVRNEIYTPEDRGKKIGLSNIRGRLYYLYGSSDCMRIDSIPGKGTSITLELKLNE